MKIEEIESLMIGKRIQEMIGEGFRVEISRRFAIPPKGRTVSVYVQSEELRDTPEENSRYVSAPTLSEALDKATNCVRYIKGKPSIERELAKLEAEDAQHAASPIVETGPDARCGCGTRKPLILERTIKLEFPWQTGQPVLDRTFGLMGIEGGPVAGEIGTCPACGRNYRLGA